MQAENSNRCPCNSGKDQQLCCGGPGVDLSASVGQMLALLRLGRHAELERSARKLTARLPHCGIAWKLLSGALASQGKNALGTLKKAAQYLPHDAEAQVNLGNALRAAAQFEAALDSYRRALAVEPHGAARKDPVVSAMRDCHMALGGRLFDSGHPGQAADQFRQALSITPESAAAHGNLGNALRRLGRLDAAEASYRQAMALDPKAADAPYNLAVVLKLQNRTAEAEALCRRALELDSSSAATIALLAKFHADRGQFREAEVLLEQAVTVNPESPEALSGVPRIRKMRPADAVWLQGAMRLADKGLAPRHEARLQFAIGKYFDDVQDYPTAFQHYRRANELVKTYRRKHDRDALARTVDLVIQSFGPEWLGRHRGAGSDSSRPVFIIGMPRSGTTLAEQILAAHPRIHGANELSYWGVAAESHLAGMLAGGPVQTLRQSADGYLRLLEDGSNGALRVVDKMPVNFMSLGLIHAAFPNARFIHMRRDPLDTCVSIYFQDFDDTYTFANDLDDLAHYYGEYVRIMQHWRSVVPADRVLEVSCEELIGDHEAWGRRMVEFIGLDWDAGCIDFHESSRTINTASNWQVRQKINSSSVGRWHHYERFIGPLMRLQALRPELSAARAST
ncbi:MAG: sulfotransferase [Steroidobacteraceae bacterium]